MNASALAAFLGGVISGMLLGEIALLSRPKAAPSTTMSRARCTAWTIRGLLLDDINPNGHFDLLLARHVGLEANHAIGGLLRNAGQLRDQFQALPVFLGHRFNGDFLQGAGEVLDLELL